MQRHGTEYIVPVSSGCDGVVERWRTTETHISEISIALWNETEREK